VKEGIHGFASVPAAFGRVGRIQMGNPGYNNRNRVERLWARLKDWRAVATRYEKAASSFLGLLNLAAALDWLRR
jgi:transposase